MYQALYRTERPEVFSQVLGQEHIVRILKNQVQSGKVGHAYLFCGTRGTGKTSIARILAKAVNCIGDSPEGKPCGVCPNCRAIQEGTFMDMIEIDAASNNGVENVRELRESVNYPPAVGMRKVYIIDEVHMLSVPAFNALLKTLEEPPENVMFILATTDPQKLPQTILSRCLRLDFHRVSEAQMAGRMKKICEEREVKITDDALMLLASNADGSVRDGLSLLDQCLAGGNDVIDRDLILEHLGAMSDEFFLKLTEYVNLRNSANAIVMLDQALREGKDVKQLMADWLSHYRNLLIAKYVKDSASMLNMSMENAERLANQSRDMELSDISDGIVTLSKTVNDARYSTQPRILLELAIITLANGLTEGKPQTKARAIPEVQIKQEPEIAAKQEPEIEVKSEAGAKADAETEQKPDVPPSPRGTTDLDELDAIWERLWDYVDDEGGSLYLVRINTQLAGINDTEFKVLATNDFVKEITERNRDTIVNAMEASYGKRLKMVVRHSEDPDLERGDEIMKTWGGSEKSAEEAGELAAELSDKFGLPLRIE